VYLIGDPKQSIYGFRGADVFAYLDAARVASWKHTLGVNYRSEKALVDAVNTLFSVRDDAFVLEGIAFRTVDASGNADATPLTIGGVAEPPFRIWKMESDEPIPNNKAKGPIAAATAAAIARLLGGDARVGDRRVRPNDIAVLVSNRWEARMIQEALADLRIPGVLTGAAKVFESHEAGELQRVLAAAAEPTREDLVRSALATDLLGTTGTDLDALANDESAWDAKLDGFSGYHTLWRTDGFVVMLRRLFLEFGIRPRLLALADGERRLTNVLHLAELIQTACVEQRLGIGGTQKWFAAQIADAAEGRDENAELRLERDDEAVRILTVHVSKGLEFDIVFCPFAWGEGKALDKDTVTFHNRDEDNRMTVALGGEAENHGGEAQRERLAELVRLLYVALTRARHRCTMVWGNFKGGANSALAHLFENTTPETLQEADRSILVEPLPELDAASYSPDEVPSRILKARVFHGKIDRTWGISSFTGLTREHVSEPETAELAEDEPAEFAVEETGTHEGIAAFPRGAKPGTCLHEIFEALDFTRDADIPGIVKRKLRAFSIAGHDDAVADTVRRTLAVSLDGADAGFMLSRVPPSSRLAELEFHFPVTALTADRLSAFPGGGWRLAFPPLNGFLKGFVDLVFEHGGKFFIADWKSNWLGPTPDSYTQEAMAAEMHRQNYRLQLHLYTVALHRYLALRIPGYDYDTHFGGVFYVFLRGIDPSRPELGLYRERPEAARIAELSALLGGTA
jgi:exodeoxyribonuclease V beta subunit